MPVTSLCEGTDTIDQRIVSCAYWWGLDLHFSKSYRAWFHKNNVCSWTLVATDIDFLFLISQKRKLQPVVQVGL